MIALSLSMLPAEAKKACSNAGCHKTAIRGHSKERGLLDWKRRGNWDRMVFALLFRSFPLERFLRAGPGPGPRQQPVCQTRLQLPWPWCS